MHRDAVPVPREGHLDPRLPRGRLARDVRGGVAGDEGGGRPGGANLVRPLYHLAWLTSRLGLAIEAPLAPAPGTTTDDGLMGTIRRGRMRVQVALRPEVTQARRGATLRVEIEAQRRHNRLRVLITGESETILVEAWLDGRPVRRRPFAAPRRTDVDMLAEVIESIGQDRLSAGVIRTAVALNMSKKKH